MRISFLLLFLTINTTSFSQKASDYLCLNPDALVYYTTYTGDTMTMQFKESFAYEGDTICYYERKMLGRESGSILYYAYNGNRLVQGSYLVNGDFNGINDMDLFVQIVEKNEQVDTSYTEAFDMSETSFDQTVTLLEAWTGKHGTTFKNVIKVDQYNITDDFHYITIFAPGIGVVSQGGIEKEFIAVEEGH